MKRAASDLRAIWTLLAIGYTPQAAAVAAALYENALTALCFSCNPHLHETAIDANGDVTLSPKTLAKLYAAELVRRADPITRVADERTIANNCYAGYKYLCKVKHPALRSAIHEIGATHSGDEYVICAAPDIRDCDAPVKHIILGIAIARLLDSIQMFALALYGPSSAVVGSDWDRRFGLAQRTAVSWLSKKRPSLPFTLYASDIK